MSVYSYEALHQMYSVSFEERIAYHTSEIKSESLYRVAYLSGAVAITVATLVVGVAIPFFSTITFSFTGFFLVSSLLPPILGVLIGISGACAENEIIHINERRRWQELADNYPSCTDVGKTLSSLNLNSSIIPIERLPDNSFQKVLTITKTIVDRCKQIEAALIESDTTLKDRAKRYESLTEEEKNTYHLDELNYSQRKDDLIHEKVSAAFHTYVLTTPECKGSPGDFGSFTNVPYETAQCLRARGVSPVFFKNDSENFSKDFFLERSINEIAMRIFSMKADAVADSDPSEVPDDESAA